MSAESPEEKKERAERNKRFCAMPYGSKVALAELRVKEWARECEKNDKNYCVSVGGLDSITLLLFVRRILGNDVIGASVSSLEDKSIQEVHKKLGVVPIKPLKSMSQILNEYGFPIYSKQIAKKLEHLQIPPSEADQRTTYYNHALMTGETGPWGHFKKSDSMKLDDKLLELFGGAWADHRPDLHCREAPFKTSAQCCHWMKVLPAQEWQQANNMWPFLGLMQSEGGQRRFSLRKYGCNYVGKGVARSCPFNYFNRQDLLRLALELNAPVPKVYGHILKKEDGTLYTTGAQRTGCVMCGFGIHLDKRPHHFDQLYARDPNQWEFWMTRCCTDPATGEKYGWGRVLDYIGVRWDPPVGMNACGEQISFFE